MSNNRIQALVMAVLMYALSPAAALTAPALMRATHALDEPRGYCIDIAGYGPTLDLDAPMQAHTCKTDGGIEDQLFEQTDSGEIRSGEYDRCLTVEKPEPGAKLSMRACADARSQRWRLTNGALSPDSRPELCVSLAAEHGEVTGTPRLVSPVYRHQAIALARCDAALAPRQTFRWMLPEERHSSLADRVRSGMPADVAAKLAAFGHEFDGPIAQQTAAIYADVPRLVEPAEIKVTKDVAYGADERQRLDIHVPTVRRSGGPVPVVLAFHGGGLIGGNRDALANVADYFASLGYVGVTGGYRLAPAAKWPEGGRDVARALTWLRDHVAEYGGDPEKIFVMGISSGALHTATFVFRPELMPPGSARPAGAILVSGPYTFDFSSPSRGELAYFGDDPSRYAEEVVVGNVGRADIPVLMTTAEWDNPRYTGPFARLFAELVTEHGVVPHYLQSLGHNHTSQLLSFGTADTSVSSVVIDFIERTSER